ncbi:MAG: hypothetical protein V4621_00515 [Pseudomonadota bacterium]
MITAVPIDTLPLVTVCTVDARPATMPAPFRTTNIESLLTKEVPLSTYPPQSCEDKKTAFISRMNTELVRMFEETATPPAELMQQQCQAAKEWGTLRPIPAASGYGQSYCGYMDYQRQAGQTPTRFAVVQVSAYAGAQLSNTYTAMPIEVVAFLSSQQSQMTNDTCLANPQLAEQLGVFNGILNEMQDAPLMVPALKLSHP